MTWRDPTLHFMNWPVDLRCYSTSQGVEWEATARRAPRDHDFICGRGIDPLTAMIDLANGLLIELRKTVAS